MSLIWGATGSMTTADTGPSSYFQQELALRQAAGLRGIPAPQQYSQSLHMQPSCGNIGFQFPMTGGIGNILPQSMSQSAPNLTQQIGRGLQSDVIFKIMQKLGSPEVTDPTAGGIAIWGSSVLKSRGHPHISRVEVIDEKVRTQIPLPHIANVYTWIKLPLTYSQMIRVLELSPNFMYDQQKQMLIIRTKSLEAAIALAALVGLYSKGEVSMYQISSYDLMRKYFAAANDKKQKKLFRKILTRCQR